MSLNELSLIVSREFDVPVQRIKSRSHKQTDILARWALIWLAIWFEGVRRKDLAEYLKCKEFTVSHAVRKIEDDLKTNPKYRAKVYAIGVRIDPEFVPPLQ